MTNPSSVDGSDPGPVTLSDLVRRAPGALSAEIDGEVVALDIAKGVCYGLDAIGARIWSLIAETTPAGDVCATLVGEYDVDAETCRNDVLDLFADLRAEGLITVRPAAALEG